MAVARIKPKQVASKTFAYFWLVVFGVLFGLPFFWTLLTSLKSTAEIYQVPPTLFPQEEWRFSNYVEIFQVAPFGRYILNSVTLVILNVFGTILSCLVVGYSFARFRWPGRDFVFTLAMATIILPREVTTIPTYIFFAKLKWLNTYLPLFLPSWFGINAFLIFLFRQYIMSIPRELDEAAFIDGANPMQILLRVLVPLCKPILTTATILTFIGVWNDFWGPYIFLSEKELFPISVGLRLFSSEAYRLTGYGNATQHLLMAGSIVAIAPCVLIFLFAQRYFVESVVSSGFKGV
jgi:ABC-type glycerol-3-phosphate transport system permease component